MRVLLIILVSSNLYITPLQYADDPGCGSCFYVEDYETIQKCFYKLYPGNEEKVSCNEYDCELLDDYYINKNNANCM